MLVLKEYIYIWSASITIDDTWKPVNQIYITKYIKPSETEHIYFSEYNAEDLERVIGRQNKVIQCLKDKHTKLHNMCIIIDDMVDDPSFTLNRKLLHQLYIRGRHSCITTVCSSQVYNAASPIIRTSLSAIFVYRLRNMNDLQQRIEEMSAIYGPKILMELYKSAAHEQSGVIYKLTVTRS